MGFTEISMQRLIFGKKQSISLKKITSADQSGEKAQNVPRAPLCWWHPPDFNLAAQYRAASMAQTNDD
jgi:hypothetical protein